MMNYVTRSNLKIDYLFVICLFSFGVVGCSKEEKSDKYVAKVNKSVLTEDQVRMGLSEEQNKGKYRSEFINSWIQNEILFQEAEKEGITNDKEFYAILERSKKELAAAFLIKKILADNDVDVNDEEVQKYYDESKDNFRLNDDAYRLNIVHFNNFDKAVLFRNKLIETDWVRALNSFQKEPAVTGSESSVLRYKYQLQPINLLKQLSDMQPNEVSTVIQTGQSDYAVVQLTDKLNKDSIPPLEFVKDEIKNRLLVIKRREFVKNYIDKLVSDHNLEIVRYTE